MAKVPNSVKNIINDYLNALKENGIQVREAYLFGSYARGNYNEFSDIDIALVSDTFEGIRIKDKDKIRKITLSTSSSIEVIPFRSEDFNSNNPLVKEILETGIQIASVLSKRNSKKDKRISKCCRKASFLQIKFRTPCLFC